MEDYTDKDKELYKEAYDFLFDCLTDTENIQFFIKENKIDADRNNDAPPRVLPSRYDTLRE